MRCTFWINSDHQNASSQPREIKHEAEELGQEGQGSANHAGSALLFIFFQQAAGEGDGRTLTQSQPGREEMGAEIHFLSFSLGRSTINLCGRIKF